MSMNTVTRQLTINQHIPTGAIASAVIPMQATDFVNTATYNNEVTPTVLNSLIRSYQSFAIRYDLTTQTFRIVTATNVSTTDGFSLLYAGDTSGRALDASWLINVTYNNGVYTVAYRGLNYVFESVSETTFYFDTNVKV